MVNLSDIAKKYLDGFIQLKKSHTDKPSGLEFAYKHSDLIDEVIVALFNVALNEPGLKIDPGSKGIALIAVGGYGRRELCPFSDIDLMLLHRLRDNSLVAQLAEKIFYPLWDLGLVVGHGTRTVKESLSTASSNFEFQTALLDARLLAGDIELFQKLRQGLTKQVKARGGKRFLHNILEESSVRHQRYGQTAYLLEPDLKEGEGGLRDINAILWAAKALLNSASFTDLVDSVFLTDFDAEALAQGLEFLLSTRNHLHFIASRKNDRLSFEHQAEIAETLGFKGENEISGTERFMRVFYTHASAIDLVSRTFWDQIKDKFLPTRSSKISIPESASKNGIVLYGNNLSLINPAAINQQPGLEIKLFRYAVEKNLSIDYKKLDLTRAGMKEDNTELIWTQAMREDFFRILGAGEAALPALEVMDYLGIISRYIPEWSYVRYLPQYDAYHLHTVDMHLFLTVAEIKKIGSGHYSASNPLLKQIYQEIEQKDLLFLAGLLHDIGKGLGKNHSKKGAKIAKEISNRMGLQAKDSKTVSFLVENHLLLTDVAMRRDLDDENVIIDLASSIVSAERLKMLYIISIADALATGPKAWDTWKDNLLRELFSKTLHIIQSGEYTSKKSIDRLRKTVSKAKAALVGRYEEKDIESFLKHMPHPYLLSQTSDNIVDHFELFEMMRNRNETVSVSSRCKDGVCELILVAKDRPGLFCKVSGVLALHGVSILGAQIYTRSDGLVFDLFKIAGYFDYDISDDIWDGIEQDIKRALEGKISLEHRIIEKAKRYKPKGALKKPPEVKIDNSSSDFYTIIEVHAQDRIGLLYTITRVMHDLNLNIHLAKVSTNVDKVIDVFYVWDVYGQKVSDEGQINDIKRAILVALEH